MKKFTEIFCIVLINLILLLLVIFFTEGIIWGCENLRMKKHNEVYINVWPIPFHSGVKHFNVDLKYFPAPENNWGRNPVGLNYKKKPIVIFGDSFVYGYNLAVEQTFFHKLSVLTKRPVYPRAAVGWGIQHMLFQARCDELYNSVPEPEFAIFILIHDHFRRLYCINFSSGHLLNEERYLRYKLKNNKLIQITDSNKILNIIKRLYLTNKLHQVYVNNFILKDKNYENYSKFTIEHFIESKEEMQKHWKNTKFVIINYNKMFNQEDFNNRLRNEGFIVISLPQELDINLNDSKYNISDGKHPNEQAWDIITPYIIKKLNLDK